MSRSRTQIRSVRITLGKLLFIPSVLTLTLPGRPRTFIEARSGRDHSKSERLGMDQGYTRTVPLQQHIAGFALAAMATAIASAQVPPLLRPIDASVEDINPLSSSLRE